MKSIIFSAFFTLLFGVCSFGQISPQLNHTISADEIIVYFQDTYDSTLAVLAQDQLEVFNEEKVKSSRYNHMEKKFYVKYTSELNKVELLAIFKELGMSPYFLENGFKISLNGTNTALVYQEID